MTTDADSVLVVGPAWIGDMVMAQSLLRVLRNNDSDVAIDVLAPGWSLPVIARMDEVRAGIESPFAHGELKWVDRRRLGQQLRERRYQRAIVLPRSFKAALIPFYADIPQRTGYRGEWRFGLINDRRRLDKTLLPRTVDRYVALGLTAHSPLPEPLPAPRLRIDTRNQVDALVRLGLVVPDKLVALMPGAEYGPAKQWPVASFGELAKRLVSQGIVVWVFGSARDRPLGEHIVATAGAGSVNLCGETSLPEAIDLIALAAKAVTNDSGLMHIAAATGTHVIAVYGSSSPRFTPPLTAEADIVWLEIECSPCFDRTCRFGHYRCLREISPDRICSLIVAGLS